MRAKIHPEYHDVVVTCACGESFNTRSTNPDLRLEICSKCHPFFTGKQKLIDSAGRVERFNKRYRNVKAPGTGKSNAKAARSPETAAPVGTDSGTPTSPGQS